MCLAVPVIGPVNSRNTPLDVIALVFIYYRHPQIGPVIEIASSAFYATGDTHFYSGAHMSSILYQVGRIYTENVKMMKIMLFLFNQNCYMS